MKRTLLILSLFLSSFVLADSNYADYKEKFKNDLYLTQYSLEKDKEKYFKFIEPFLTEAENVLKIPKKFKNIPDKLCKDYFSCLLNYNAAFFNNYSKPSSPKKATVDFWSKEVRNTIEQIKKDVQALKNLDSKQEFKDTLKLLNKANITYYKKIGLKSKFLIFLLT